MTRVSITELNDGFLFECRGHAGYAGKGADIVCAGISALCMALISRLETLADENILSVESFHRADGELSAEVKYGDGELCRVKAREVLETVRAGFERIEALYPEYAEIE